MDGAGAGAEVAVTSSPTLTEMIGRSVVMTTRRMASETGTTATRGVVAEVVVVVETATTAEMIAGIEPSAAATSKYTPSSHILLPFAHIYSSVRPPTIKATNDKGEAVADVKSDAPTNSKRARDEDHAGEEPPAKKVDAKSEVTAEAS